MQITPEQTLQAFLYVAGIFALLPGVALLVAALVNSLKAVGSLIGFSFDGRADQISAWLNLIFFFVLIGFRVLNPSLAFDWLDARAKIIADALINLAFLFGQFKLSPAAYLALKNKLPLVGFSYKDAA